MFKVMETVYGIEEQWNVCVDTFATEDEAQAYCDKFFCSNWWVEEDTDPTAWADEEYQRACDEAGENG